MYHSIIDQFLMFLLLSILYRSIPILLYSWHIWYPNLIVYLFVIYLSFAYLSNIHNKGTHSVSLCELSGFIETCVTDQLIFEDNRWLYLQTRVCKLTFPLSFFKDIDRLVSDKKNEGELLEISQRLIRNSVSVIQPRSSVIRWSRAL